MGSDAFTFPHDDPSQVQQKLWGENTPTSHKVPNENFRTLFPEIIGRSEPLYLVLDLVIKIARSNSSVLILGESGTGKELIASAIHRLSERRQHNFVAINCSAIPEELLEAELFGHEKGAFTGADKRRVGYFGIADQGTLFLDEIGDMPARLQAKLLRVLQEKKYTPVGSNSVQKIDVRIIAATNKDLEKAVESKTFRLDLFYRLNVFPIRLPSLSQRSADIELLLNYFCMQMNNVHPHQPPTWFDQDALQCLSEQTWPGNVRQLQNLVERLVITRGGGRIGLEDLPAEFIDSVAKPEPESSWDQSPPKQSKDYSYKNFIERNKSENNDEGRERSLENLTVRSRPSTQCPENFGRLPKEGIHLNNFVEDLENSLIVQALERTHNNKNQAAKLLNLNRTTLVEKIKKRNIRIGASNEREDEDDYVSHYKKD
ncbi:MAG: sigma-54-dependent Fis family transcriptional regulator [Oligoflexales bacterium]|nr:sigma-54-dependent Fis family transcriptional regulator [Oligoflexales bacterium]